MIPLRPLQTVAEEAGTPAVAAAPSLPDVATLEVFLAGLALVCASLALVPLLLAFGRRLLPERRVFFARWGFSHVLLATGVFLLVSLFAGAALRALDSDLPEILQAVLATVVSWIALSATLCVFAVRLDPAGVGALGFSGGRHLRAIGLGLLCYVLLFPGLQGLGLAWPWLLERFGVVFELQQVAQALPRLEGGELVLGVALAAIVIPFFEEVVFRGFLQPLLVQNLGDRGGVVLTALVFASLHGDSAFLPIFGLALLLGALMLRSRSLPAVWCVHGLHNGLMLAIALLGQAVRDTAP